MQRKLYTDYIYQDFWEINRKFFTFPNFNSIEKNSYQTFENSQQYESFMIKVFHSDRLLLNLNVMQALYV